VGIDFRRLAWWRIVRIPSKPDQFCATRSDRYEFRRCTCVVNLISSSHDCIVGHPLTMMFGLFAAGSLLSQFAQEIKGFLGYWPLRTIRAGTQNAMQNKLRTLESLHNSALCGKSSAGVFSSPPLSNIKYSDPTISCMPSGSACRYSLAVVSGFACRRGDWMSMADRIGRG
jgi:hypothetical protein